MDPDEQVIVNVNGVDVTYSVGDVIKAVDACWDDGVVLPVDPERAKRELQDMNVAMTLDQLNRSAKGGDLDTVRLLLSAGVRDKPNRKAFHRSSITYAAQFGNLEVIRELLASGADYYAAVKNHSALRFAAMRGEMPIIKFLVGLGIDHNEEDNEGYTPFLISVQYNQLEAAAFFVEMGTDIKHQANDGMTAMKYVTQSVKNPALKRYIKSVYKDHKGKK